ncbi:hypothetical protein J4405_00995 [Candidatus Woesearchaeota archaeon]|nr:hypothetical protein [Candidatus Woesearchaeota archaeon]
MVKEINKHNKLIFVCEECSLSYDNKKLAEKCEAWCKKNSSCNLKITRYSNERKNEKKLFLKEKSSIKRN